MRSSMRQSNHRNQRSKGMRVKQFLQLFLLTSVCIWLVYQLKHSYVKKLAMEEGNGNFANNSETLSEGQTDLPKLGRKDPHEKMGITSRGHSQKDGHQEVEEKETKQETDDEERGGGDDEFDETEDQDQSEANEEGGHGEEAATEEDTDTQGEGTEALDGEEHEGNRQEAREEHYKKDDASSSVHHDTQTTETELGNEENVQNKKNDVETETGANEKLDGSKMNTDTDTIVQAVDAVQVDVSTPTLGETETMSNGNLSENTNPVENKDSEVEGSDLGVPSLSNSTSVEYGSQMELQTNSTASTESNKQMELQNATKDVLPNQIQTQNGSTDADTVTTSVPMQNESLMTDSTQVTNDTVDADTTGEDKPTMAAALSSNATIDTGSTGEAKPGIASEVSPNDIVDTGSMGEDQPNMGAAVVELTENPNTTKVTDAEQAATNSPPRTSENSDGSQGDAAHGESIIEKANTSENGDTDQEELEDTSQNTVTLEETEARTDLSTLRTTEIETIANENEALE